MTQFFRIHIIHGKGDIVVERCSQEGQVLGIVTGKTPEDIRRKIAESDPASLQTHSFHLGFELAKAAIALGLNIKYEQGRELEFPDGKMERINYMEKVQFKTNEIPEKEREYIESKFGGRFFTYMRQNGNDGKKEAKHIQ